MVYVNRRLLGQQRDKLYREALRLILAEDPDIPPPRVTAADGPMKRLRAIARVHVKKAEEGDMQAIKDLADRLDGKPGMAMYTEDEEGNRVPFRGVIEFVRAARDERDSDT